MTNKKYDGIIFDLDGTLVDTLDDITDALNDTLAEYNVTTKATIPDVMSWIGHGLGELIHNAIPEVLDTEEKREQAHESISRNYAKRWTNKAKAYPGVKELFTYCNNQAIPIAVSSNKSNDGTRYIIKNLFPEIEFFAVEGLRPGIKRKPDPFLTNQIVKGMDIPPDRILYVGDSETDYMTAKNIGAQSVLVNYGYGKQERLKEKDDAFYIDNLTKVIDILEDN